MQFSLVSYLDSNATQQIRTVQEELSRLTGSKAVLNHWLPHITIGDGITVDSKQLAAAESKLTQLAKEQAEFTVSLQGIGSIDNWVDGAAGPSTPYVIWVNVVPNEKLLSLVAHVKSSTTDGLGCWYKMPQPYAPHVTLAFRDLSKEGYETGLQYLKDMPIALTSSVDHLALVERQDNGDVEYRRFNFISS